MRNLNIRNKRRLIILLRVMIWWNEINIKTKDLNNQHDKSFYKIDIKCKSWDKRQRFIYQGQPFVFDQYILSAGDYVHSSFDKNVEKKGCLLLVFNCYCL